MRDFPRLHVAVICGGLPLDATHLAEASHDVELTVYCSLWSPQGRNAGKNTPFGVTVRDFMPLVRTNRGHLTYVYPGLSQALQADRPDVVYVISEPWGLLAVQAALWVRANRPTRLIVHGCDTIWHHGGPIKQQIRRQLLQFTLPKIDAFIAESEKALNLARCSGLPERSIQVRIHTNPRNGQLFQPAGSAQRAQARAAFGLSGNTTAIGLLGRLVPEKGVRLFLEAAHLLLDRGFPAQFLIAGDGPLRYEVQRVKSAGITYLGALSHPCGVLTFFSALDVLACPSLATPNWEDQGPRSMLEAMMCGCIPMGTPTGAIAEMLKGRGVVAESTDPRAVADALVNAARLSADPMERAELARWARSRFSGHAVARQLVELWQRVHADDRFDGREWSL
jgi:glycosyltransferase involved in cell wall biosynthesis